MRVGWLAAMAVVTTAAVSGCAGATHATKLIHSYSDVAAPPGWQNASALDLASRSLTVPGVRSVEMVLVTKQLGSHYIGGSSRTDPQRIVTDYAIRVSRSWSNHRVAEPHSILRIPGGRIGKTVDTAEDAPRVTVGQSLLVWDVDVSPTAPAGSSTTTMLAVSNNQNEAVVTNGETIAWAGKTAPLASVEQVLTNAARYVQRYP